MSEQFTQAFRLKGHPILIHIDKSLFEKYGINDNVLNFDLVISKDKRITLVGPSIHPGPRQGKPLLEGVGTNI